MAPEPVALPAPVPEPAPVADCASAVRAVASPRPLATSPARTHFVKDDVDMLVSPGLLAREPINQNL